MWLTVKRKLQQPKIIKEKEHLNKKLENDKMPLKNKKIILLLNILIYIFRLTWQVNVTQRKYFSRVACRFHFITFFYSFYRQ